MSRLLLSLFLTISLGINLVLAYRMYDAQIVVSVPDGDSIQLRDGRRIRLLGIDAPEKGRCGAEAAQLRLTDFVKGNHVTLHDIVTDDYGRQLANVYVKGIFINGQMVENGYTKYTSITSPESERMKALSAQSQTEKRGIYSETCRPLTGPNGCTIKGNLKEGNHTYHLPGCKNYDQTIIDLAFGDQWFCSEKDALAAGFQKASGCR